MTIQSTAPDSHHTSHSRVSPSTAENSVSFQQPETHGRKLLRERGIESAARQASWQVWELRLRETYWGWRYPIFDIDGSHYRNSKGQVIYRWKNFDKVAYGGEKYRWLFGQQGCPPWYILPGTRKAIQQANGLVYIAAGEPDVLAYKSAGVHNVISWLNGEKSVPKDLASLCARLGITQIRFLVDRDSTGEASAQSVANALGNTSIVYTPYHLPEYLGSKGDINDLWRWTGFKANNFHALLTTICADQTLQLSLSPSECSRSDFEVHPTRVSLNSNGHRPIQPNSSPPNDKREAYIEWVKQEVMPLLSH